MSADSTPDHDPAAALLDCFTRHCGAGGHVHFIQGADGPALVDSPRHPGRRVVLVWSDALRASEWGAILVREPQVKSLTRAEFVVSILPEIATAGLLVGPDWGDQPIEPECETEDLQIAIAKAAIDHFADEAVRSGHIYILRGPDGPAGLASPEPTVAGVLPVWTDRADVQAFAAGDFQGFSPQRLSLPDFMKRNLLWCIEAGWRIAPGYVSDAATIALRPADLKARLKAVADGETRSRISRAA